MRYFGTKISDNMAETPEGFLLCLNVPIGRLGVMEYGPNEVPIEAGKDGVVRISRDEEDLFSEATIASFQGKPLTIRHPEQFVDPKNWKDLAKGVMQNVRRGSGEFKDDLVCDLLITDEFAISLVKNGVRELSCGYEAEYTEMDEGKGKQTNIVGNHLALVEEGRAGSSYAVRDHKGAESMDKKFLERLKNILTGKTVDAAALDKAFKDAESEPTANEPAKMSDESKAYMDEVLSGFKKICDEFMEKMGKGKDEEKVDKEKGKDADKEKKEGEDADNSLEERLKKLELAVSKLLEGKSGDEEEEEVDDDGEVIEDEREEESEDEEPDMTGDDKAHAEILCPGIRPSKDVKVKALKAAYGTKDGKRIIEALTGGKAPSYDKPEQVELLFTGAAELLKAQRGGELSTTKRFRATSDEFQSSIFDQENVMTAEKMNELNAKRYNVK